MQLTELSDDALVSQLAAICLEGHRLTARLIEYLVEVEERRLDLKAACSSMFDFCVRRLGMSEGAAFRRINAARLVKRYPRLLARIEVGALGLSTLVLLKPHLLHLSEEKVDELAVAVAGKTQRQIEELLARLAPKPDVPSAILEIPIVPRQVELGSVPAPESTRMTTTRARIEPLSEARFKVQLTASAALRDKLERARDLMSHANPSGDLAPVVERALDLLLAKLEKERLGKVTRSSSRASTTKPKRTDASSAAPRERAAIPRAVRREVFERDGERCTFVDAEGRRCPCRAHLELDHAHSHALGGADDAANLRVRCRAHNRLHAEEVFGREHVAREIDFRQRKSRRVMNIETPPTIDDVALRGLVTMGFAKADARRALEAIARRRSTLPVQDVLREAIGALT